jgi:hypothetical protein
MSKLRVESDGTMRGTHVFLDEGVEIPQNIITRIVIDIDPSNERPLITVELIPPTLNILGERV